jgi:hypothetical protein
MDVIETKTPTAIDALTQIVGGYCVARCLHAVVGCGVADQLQEDQPRTAAELAAAVGVNPDALYRMMRLLATHGVFEARGDAFQHSALSRLLRSDHPQSMLPFAQLFGQPVYWQIYEKLDYSLKTGRPAAEKVIPEGFFGYMENHPEANSIFNAAMASKAYAHVAAITAAYDFSGFQLVGDIGGGYGHLLRGILEATPQTSGLLFDLPHVINEVGALASDRLILQAGDFFKDPLPVCDAYILLEIIHDWDDKDALAILKAIRKAAPAHARVLLIERMIATDSGPDFSVMLDIHMLALLGGRQRTLQEYQQLLTEAGFRFEREITTFVDMSILEAVPD